MTAALKKASDEGVALPAEGVDRNLVSGYQAVALEKSPSPRRAWIEIK